MDADLQQHLNSAFAPDEESDEESEQEEVEGDGEAEDLDGIWDDDSWVDDRGIMNPNHPWRQDSPPDIEELSLEELRAQLPQELWPEMFSTVAPPLPGLYEEELGGLSWEDLLGNTLPGEGSLLDDDPDLLDSGISKRENRQNLMP